MKVESFFYRVMVKLSPLFPAKFYLKIFFRRWMGYKFNYNHPQTFNEKLNWLKLYDHNPLYTQLADKYLVKQYVSKVIGDAYVVPMYGVWDSFEKIEWDKLPNQFVLKATHDSSGATICKDKKSFDLEKAKAKFNKSLRNNYYWPEREWIYKNIKPRIIADKYLDDHTGKTLLDYKFWCFNGVPTYMYCTVKDKEIFENFYDMNFNPVNINHGFSRRSPEFSKPKNFDKMKEFATILSKDMPFVRIDFFEVEDHLYFGEFTFYDWGGARPFNTIEQDYELGSLIKLPIEK